MTRNGAGSSRVPLGGRGRPRSGRTRRTGHRIAVVLTFVVVVVALTLALLGVDRALGAAGPDCSPTLWTVACR